MSHEKPSPGAQIGTRQGEVDFGSTKIHVKVGLVMPPPIAFGLAQRASLFFANADARRTHAIAAEVERITAK